MQQDDFLEGLKVISATESRLIEEYAVIKGASAQGFMEKAGFEIASYVAKFVDRKGLQRVVSLLVGKGNNGGDAYAAGLSLLKQGFLVKAYPLFPLEKSSSLNQHMHKKFLDTGGIVEPLVTKKEHLKGLDGLILDGLLGTGFCGNVEGVLALAIQEVNKSSHPVIAIDLPSGLNADTGDVQGVAILADATLCLGAPKVGFFLNRGWDHVGSIEYLDFGLSCSSIDAAQGVAYLLREEVMKLQLPKMARGRHKYEAGYVLALAGSSGMRGAALLSCFAALRSGAGIVRLFHPEGMESELSSSLYELICQPLEGSNIKPLLQEEKRAKALLMGPGMGRGKQAESKVQKICRSISLPCVIDADALFFFSKHSSWIPPMNSILTPHRGEALALIPKKTGNWYEEIQRYVEKKKTTLVLKGAPTWIFHPGCDPLVCVRGDPGMATAGSGDVLTGIIAAFLAQGLSPRVAAAMGVYMHGLAGEKAARKLTSYCMIGSDIIAHLPDVFLDFCGNGIA